LLKKGDVVHYSAEKIKELKVGAQKDMKTAVGADGGNARMESVYLSSGCFIGEITIGKKLLLEVAWGPPPSESKKH